MRFQYSSNIISRYYKLLTVWMVMIAALVIGSSNAKCEFEAIFNFGDSNSDTGGFWAAFPAQSGPFGMTYFGRPSGRASDGRLIVDFLAQALGVPFLSPYLQSIGSDYRHGANYATLASTVLLPKTSLFVSGLSPFSLAIQLNQMKEFKVRVDELYSKGARILPSPDIFWKSLYMLYIGQNDFTSNLTLTISRGGKRYLTDVVYQISSTIEELYVLGGRTFLVLNLAPVGCYPSFLVAFRQTSWEAQDFDEFGCVVSYNKAVVDYNTMLKKELARTRETLLNASVVYVDIYSAMLKLFQHPTSYGFEYGIRACCGHGGGSYNYNPQVYCGASKMINGSTVTASACGDPYDYVSWDGIHATEAANKLVALAILNGSISDPPFHLEKLCNLHYIS